MKTALLRISYVVGLGVVFLAALFLLLTSGAMTPVDAAEAADEKVYQYIGSVTCAKACHKSAKKGSQLKIWEASKHATAFATLASDQAMAIAKERGIADPQKAEECLACHITAPGATAAEMGKKFSNEEGVGCERCHGAGSGYKKMSTMKSREKSVAAGLRIPDEATCTKCHNDGSPTFKGFDYDEYLAKIAHPKPAAPAK